MDHLKAEKAFVIAVVFFFLKDMQVFFYKMFQSMIDQTDHFSI